MWEKKLQDREAGMQRENLRKDLAWSLSKEELRWGRVWGFLLEKIECEMRSTCQPPERH